MIAGKCPKDIRWVPSCIPCKLSIEKVPIRIFPVGRLFDRLYFLLFGFTMTVIPTVNTIQSQKRSYLLSIYHIEWSELKIYAGVWRHVQPLY